MAKFEIKTTAQVERTYTVEAEDEDQAQKRLRTHIKDADSLREGVVTKHDGEQNTTPERIKGVEDVTVPEGVTELPGQAEK